MKSKLKKIAMAFSLLLAGGYGQISYAHEQSGFLGLGAGSTDLYQVNCFDDGEGNGASAGLKFSILTKYAPPGLKISVRAHKGAIIRSVTDNNGNGNSYPSQFVYNPGGDGYYYVSVGKTIYHTAYTGYFMQFHCENSTGGHTGTSWIMLQNQ